MKTKKIIPIIIFTILGVFIIRDILFRNHANEEYTKRGVIVNGTLISYGGGPKSSISVDYFIIKNQDTIMLHQGHHGLNQRNVDYFRGKRFPVITLPEKPYEGRILITPKDFSELGLKFPDSLKWVLPYIAVSDK